MTALDLFCGCGGLSAGLVEAGIDVVCGVDRSASALKYYARNLGRPVLRADLSKHHRTARQDTLRLNGLASEVDMIVGSPPCQEYSGAGHQREGDQAHLTVAFAEIVARHQPRVFMMENVPNAARYLTYQDARRILEGHYRTTEVVVNMAMHGVPQTRHRLILAGFRDGDHRQLTARLSTAFEDPPTVRQVVGENCPDHFYRHPAYAKKTPSIFSADGPAPTMLASPNKSRVRPAYRFHKRDSTTDLSLVEVLTPRHAALIQTFPRHWDLPRDATTAWRLVGNAVPPRAAFVLGRDLQMLPREESPPAPAVPPQVAADPCFAFALERVVAGGGACDGPASPYPEINADLVRLGILREKVSYELTERGRAIAAGLLSRIEKY